jgi:hypothetical protein
MARSGGGAADEFFSGLAAVLRVLEPRLGDIVLVGGWVPYLLASVRSPGDRTDRLLTRDIDLAVPEDLGSEGTEIDQLLVSSGLRYEYRSLSTPPVRSYVGLIGGCPVEVEFLTDERGGEERVVEVGGALSAQSLHYVRILLENTERVPVKIEGRSPLLVRVPTAPAFVYNKGLTFTQRNSPPKKAKDLYYIFEVLSGREDSMTSFAADLAELQSRYAAKWGRRFLADLDSHFVSVGSEGVRLVRTQRPARAYTGLDDDQFGQYVWSLFREFTDLLKQSR